MSAGLFITGTDTGVGKSHVAAGLLRRLRARGLRVAGYKPVAAGCVSTPEGLRNDDALALRAASSDDLPYALVNPVALAPPVAPHIAARAAGLSISIDELVAGCAALAARAEWIVVEGAGGWRVPLNDHQGFDDLAVALGFPVVLVVGVRLGCINHALLSIESIARRGVPLAGWIANRIDPDMAEAEANIETLRERIAAPCLGVVEYGCEVPEALVARLLEERE